MHDPTSFLQTALLVSGLIVLVLFGVRKGYVDLLKQTSEGWEKAAALKSEEVRILTERVSKLEVALETLKTEHSQVIRLNIELQLECEHQKTQILALEGELGQTRGGRRRRMLVVTEQEQADAAKQ